MGFVVLAFAAVLPSSPPLGALLSASSSDRSHSSSDVSCSFPTFAVLALISKTTYWGTYHDTSRREFSPCSVCGASPLGHVPGKQILQHHQVTSIRLPLFRRIGHAHGAQSTLSFWQTANATWSASVLYHAGSQSSWNREVGKTK